MTEQETKQEPKEVDIQDKIIGEIELPKFDPTKYIGMKSKIASVKTFEGKFGYYIDIESLPLDTFEKDGETKEIKATKRLSIHTNDKNEIGWGKGTVTGDFMKKYECDKLKDLIDKEIVIQTITKSGKDFLTFN